MNKFKKIGFSVLAGSLVAVSANAGEMSVAGSASVALEHINGGAASAGKSWSMGNQLTFSGSGELDNGMNVSLSFIIDQGDDETDNETGAKLTVNTGSKNVRKKYSEYYNSKRNEFIDFFKKSGSGIIECNTHDDYQKKLLKYFKSR